MEELFHASPADFESLTFRFKHRQKLYTKTRIPRRKLVSLSHVLSKLATDYVHKLHVKYLLIDFDL